MNNFSIKVKEYDDVEFGVASKIYVIKAHNASDISIFGAEARVAIANKLNKYLPSWGSCNGDSMEHYEAQYACIAKAMEIARDLNK